MQTDTASQIGATFEKEEIETVEERSSTAPPEKVTICVTVAHFQRFSGSNQIVWAEQN
jgi:hypothetical protein